MLNALTFKTVQRELTRIEELVKDYMPCAEFVFTGCDNAFVYFNVATKDINDEDLHTLKVKSYFQLVAEKRPARSVYIGEFKSRIFA